MTRYQSAMNSIIQGQLDRVDAALNTLIDSIASYNPSIAAAKDLLAADDELTRGVKSRESAIWIFFILAATPLMTNDRSVTTHQVNHARILALRTQVSALNSSVTNSLTTLAETRAEILSQKITPVTEHARQVPYQTLLEYAAQISRYAAKDRRYVKRAPASTEEVNGADVTTQQDMQDATKEGEQPVIPAFKQAPFVPWPTEATIKQGALGRIQAMVEIGQDPAIVGFQETVNSMNDEAIEEEKVTADIAASDNPRNTQEVERRPTLTDEKPKVFGGLDLYDPDDMDDE